MQKNLLIVASGKSSRFGGYPKAFARIGSVMNVENTIQKAAGQYDRIYVAVNRETYAAYKGTVAGCEMFSIETGNGDAHSLLKCLKHIRGAEPGCGRLAVCWGDACFASSLPFVQIGQAVDRLPGDIPALVACAEDEAPYAWFETAGENIRRSHFAKVDGPVDRGLHDQSLFVFGVDLAIAYLEEYKQVLGIGDAYEPDGPEMKLLYSFEYLYGSEKYSAARYAPITAGNVFSFNTKEELETIKEKICP